MQLNHILKKQNTKASALAFTEFLLSTQQDRELTRTNAVESNHEEPHQIDILESAVQSTIIDWLDVQEKLGKLMYNRVNVGGVYDARIQGYRSLANGVKGGFSDIYIMKDGKSYFVELKRTGKKGKQSEDQKEFEQLVIKNGGTYLLVRSLEFLKSKLG